MRCDVQFRAAWLVRFGGICGEPGPLGKSNRTFRAVPFPRAHTHTRLCRAIRCRGALRLSFFFPLPLSCSCQVIRGIESTHRNKASEILLPELSGLSFLFFIFFFVFPFFFLVAPP